MTVQRANPAPAARRTYVLMVWIAKGGCRKSTTAIMTAIALARQNPHLMINLYDFDTTTQGVADYFSLWLASVPGAEIPDNLAIYQYTSSDSLAVAYVQKRNRETEADIAIIDLGGENPELASQLARLTDLVISPCGSDPAEMRRLPGTRTTLRGAGSPRHQVLLTRVAVPGQGAAAEARAALTDTTGPSPDPYDVLPMEVPRNLAIYADTWGQYPDDCGVYEDVARYVAAQAAQPAMVSA